MKKSKENHMVGMKFMAIKDEKWYKYGEIHPRRMEEHSKSPPKVCLGMKEVRLGYGKTTLKSALTLDRKSQGLSKVRPHLGEAMS